MKKVLLGLTVLVVLAAACSKKDEKDATANPPTTTVPETYKPDWQVSSMKLTNPGDITDNDSTRINYTSDKSIESFESYRGVNGQTYSKMRFEYVNGKPVKIYVKEKDTEKLFRELTYENDKLLKVKHLDNPDYYDSLTYEGNKLIRIRVCKQSDRLSFTEAILTWKDEDVVTVEKYGSDVMGVQKLQLKLSLAYNDKPAIKNKNNLIFALRNDLQLPEDLSAHQIIDRSVWYASGELFYSLYFDQVYSGDGQPVKETQRIKLGMNDTKVQYNGTYYLTDLNKK